MSIKRALLGRPLATAEELGQRVPKLLALPIFASDTISSTAYATEEILLALVLAGTAAVAFSFWVALAVVVLLALVAVSYQQTVRAYPNGGGSYVVASENLGAVPGMVAASALMVDYVMTVAVSVSSGTAAILAAFPSLAGNVATHPDRNRVLISVGIVVFMALVNLRGIKETGRLFAVPTYLFVLLCGGLVVVGIARILAGDLRPLSAFAARETSAQGVALGWIILRAFSGGCSAMTGTEAIANAVPVFKQPESRNASVTLGIMAAILGFLLLGITGLAQWLHVTPQEGTTVLGQLGLAVYEKGFLFYALQIATMAILVMAANTSFGGFPRLAAVLAQDGLMPRQFMNRGERLVFSNGIIVLAAAAIAVLVIFRAKTHSLIPLYAVGVFTSFTLSQAGMVNHWFRLRGSGWKHRALMNGVGAVLTAVVTLVILVTKFVHGAYLVVIAVGILMAGFQYVRTHYARVASLLEPKSMDEERQVAVRTRSKPRTTVVLFVSQINRLVANALAFGRGLSPDEFRAVTIASDPAKVEALREKWKELGIEVPLVVVDSPYRELTRPAVEYVRSLGPGPDHVVTVIIPEFVVEHWWDNVLHNQSALRLKVALRAIPWVVIVSMPYQIGQG
ncbi:MAG: APC family permease [Thermoleophilia bacterium]|nr:APC family permease [Thermoleophilia bacterium]